MISQISSDTRITSAQFEERCPKELAQLFNESLLKKNTTYPSLKLISGLYCYDVYFSYCMDYVEGRKRFRFDSSVTLSHELGIIYSMKICDFILRRTDVISALRGFYKNYGIILDEDLKDLKNVTMIEIQNSLRISSQEFANRCGVEVLEYFDNILKEASKDYTKVIDVKGLHYPSKYIRFLEGFDKKSKVSCDQSITVKHDLGDTTRINFLSYILRSRIAITQLRNYYLTFGIILDNDLRDLKIII